MDRRLLGILIGAILVGGYFYFHLISVKDDSKQSSFSIENINSSNPVSRSKNMATDLKPETVINSDASPDNPSPNRPAVVQKLTKFSDAYDQCRGNIRCDVAGDPWKEYIAIKEEDRGGEKTLAILNFLMSQLDNASYRDSAKKIILDSFHEGTQLYYWYLGDFYHLTGEQSLAKEIYDQYRKKFADKPELVNWASVGNFYYDTGDLITALECYQKELRISGRREGVREDVTKESLNFLEDRITEIKKGLTQ